MKTKKVRPVSGRIFHEEKTTEIFRRFVNLYQKFLRSPPLKFALIK